MNSSSYRPSVSVREDKTTRIPASFEHADDIVGRRFSARAEMRDELTANLLDLRGCVAWLREPARHFEDQRFLCC